MAPGTAVRRASFGSVAAFSLALAACGTVQLPEVDPIVTGSLKAQPASLPMPQGPAPDGIAPSDWAQAKIALDQALSVRELGASIPWDNPLTGARGTSTPLGALKDNGCRDFRIGIVDTKGEQWVQGEACERSRGAIDLAQVRVLGRA